jgi:hypothetical protein
MTKLKQFFEANSYIINVDNYPFTNDKETVLGIQEALMSVKGWLIEKKLAEQKTYEYLKEKAKTDIIHRSMYLMSGAEIDCLDKLLEDLQDVFLPQSLCVDSTKKVES